MNKKHTKKSKAPKPFLISINEKEQVIQNISLLLSAGVTLSEALVTIAKEVKSGNFKSIINFIIEEVDAGSPFYRALKSTGVFPDHVVSLVKLGEESGRLSENLILIAKEQEKSRSFKSKIRAAMAYPLIVLVLALLVGTGIAWFVLPRLAQVFSEMRVELPYLTKMMIDVGIFLKEYGYLAIPGIWAAFFVISYFLFGNKKTKIIGQTVIGSIPVVNGLLRNVELARFGFVMGSLLEAGLPIVTALDFLIESTSLGQYKKYYTSLRAAIDAGQSFSKFFDSQKKHGFIPLATQQMIVAGEASGNLPAVFNKIADIYQEKADLATKNLPTVMEPLLLFVVWFAVLFVALAVIMPIYGLLNGLN